MRPGSIRDSMWRAEWLVTQFISELGISAKDTVLVAGLGPTGITATWLLLHTGCEVVVCNRPEPDYCSIRGSSSRVICPTTYDYPARHWRKRIYPIEYDVRSFEWSASTGRDLIEDLTNDLTNHENYARCTMNRHTEVKSIESDGNHLVVHVQSTKSGQNWPINGITAVVNCVGPGTHRLSIPSLRGKYKSMSFWSNDDALFPPLQRNETGSVDRYVRPRVRVAGQKVAIIGSGDGGLQDFVSLLTGVGDPYCVLERLPIPRAMLRQLIRLNRKLLDPRLYHSGGASAHQALIEAQRPGMDVADRIWTYKKGIPEKIDAMLLDRDVRPAVQLISPCFHFGPSYTANRIATHLIARALVLRGEVENAGMKPFRAGVVASNIEGHGHHCETAMECVRHKHVLYFQERVCPGEHRSPAYMLRATGISAQPWQHTVSMGRFPEVFDRVICRFGADFKADAVKLQVPPYYYRK